jgi:SHO1 osmosensor
MSAGWLILAMVDIVWVLYFTSEEDSLQLHVFNSFGTGGLSPPSRRRRAGRGQSLHMSGNGYGGAYGGGGIGPGDLPYDTKIGAPPMGGTMSARSQGSIAGGIGGDGSIGNVRSMSAGGGTASITNVPTQLGTENLGASSPLMGSGNAGVGAGGGVMGSPDRSAASELNPPPPSDAPNGGAVYKAKALYACKCFYFLNRHPLSLWTFD